MFNRHHVRHFHRRIVSTYNTATPGQYAEGAGWYDDARNYCGDLSATYGVPVEVAAGIVAVLSPMTEWSLNKRRAAEILNGVNGGMLNAAKAVAIRDGANPADVVGGRKVTAFYRAILGDPDAIVIDRHAFDVAVGRRTDDKTRKVLELVGQYDLFVEAYARAAADVGSTPVVVQAVTWTVQRTTESAFSSARMRELVVA